MAMVFSIQTRPIKDRKDSKYHYNGMLTSPVFRRYAKSSYSLHFHQMRGLD